MNTKIEQIKSERPKLRKVIDTIVDHFDIMMIVYYIIMIISALFFISVPTLIVFFQCPDDIRGWIASIVGGTLSIVVIPILLNYLTNKQKKNMELKKMLNEINKPLYDELSKILIDLLVDEYIIHGKNPYEKISSECSKEATNVLCDFLRDNYSQISNYFSVSLIWNLVEICNECSNNKTTYDNIRIKVRKCFRSIRKEVGSKGKFYENRFIIEKICERKENLNKSE